MKETKNMDMYEAPQVEVIEVEVEKGFAMSLTGSAPDSDDSEFGGLIL